MTWKWLFQWRQIYERHWQTKFLRGFLRMKQSFNWSCKISGIIPHCYTHDFFLAIGFSICPSESSSYPSSLQFPPTKSTNYKPPMAALATSRGPFHIRKFYLFEATARGNPFPSLCSSSLFFFSFLGLQFLPALSQHPIDFKDCNFGCCDSFVFV